jgi:hypothetical protein
MELALDGWKAWLSDGKELCDNDPDLKVEELGPWRELERLCREHKIDIIAAEVFCGLYYIKFEATYPLTCGMSFHEIRGMSGQPAEVRSYRWIRRDEPNRWLWGVCNFQGAWQVEAPVGIHDCPDPIGIIEFEKKNGIIHYQ